MKTIEEYKKEQNKKLSSIEKELNILEKTDLELFVSKNNHGRIEFEVRDYAIANRVEIEEYGTYGCYYKMIHFMHDVKTSEGNLEVYCRHEYWNRDTERFAQVYVVDDWFTKRHNTSELIEFYREKGAPENLLDELLEKVETLYKEPKEEESLLEDSE